MEGGTEEVGRREKADFDGAQSRVGRREKARGDAMSDDKHAMTNDKWRRERVRGVRERAGVGVGR